MQPKHPHALSYERLAIGYQKKSLVVVPPTYGLDGVLGFLADAAPLA